MSACNWCGENEDYIKERSKQMEDKLCGACLNAYEQDLSEEVTIVNMESYINEKEAV